tara:strand:+ start:109 stop:657 length:549 start_codon:yes stop_codon:yes gene_type:complete
MQSTHFNLEILDLNHAQLQLEYYFSNKEHLEVWEPERSPKKFYTLKYQQNKIKELLDLIQKGKSAHFIILNKSKSLMIGACNYTKIKNKKCWLGYSISKDFEGKNLMYEALLLTNSYVYNNLGVRKIRAGILPDNKRSMRLIKRLHFEYIGKKDELEINGEMKTYDTYIQKMIKKSNIYIKK